MAYEKTNWQNGSQGGTPLNADNLNKMEAGIFEATAGNPIVVNTVDDIPAETPAGTVVIVRNP